MNKIRAIQELNKKEIEQGISPNASWHVDYRDTAFVYFGGLPYELSEGDVITIFSQFGEPTFLKLARDKETGKSRGFGWLKYEDQRSTDLAVDNLGGATINGRMISVDHARYKPRDDEDMDECRVDWETLQRRERLEKGGGGDDDDTDMGDGSEDEAAARSRHRPMLKEERELMLLEQDHDEDDPMKAFLIDEKKKEVEDALRRAKKKKDGDNRHASRHHRSHRSRRDDSEDDRDRHRRRRRRHGEEDEGRRERSRRDDTPALKDADENDDRRERRRRSSRIGLPTETEVIGTEIGVDHLEGRTGMQNHQIIGLIM
ncbi:putative u2 snrnp component ist3 [Diaporthe ampelina]|uniref:Putative u2 snrnp component ist3 n=1 Tax=Diaporthe ampelina TaxID=1214573 RepID=A0A0G2H257_9PEZI|nr:putative u2 snrnp component ist3 [Diaporthe ampelina]